MAMVEYSNEKASSLMHLPTATYRVRPPQTESPIVDTGGMSLAASTVGVSDLGTRLRPRPARAPPAIRAQLVCAQR
jgi:hypothetical protein